MRPTRELGAMAIGASIAFAMTGSALADGMPSSKAAAAAPPPAAAEPARGPCYVRADIGYGWAAGDHAVATTSLANYLPTSGIVRSPDFDGSWFGEIGFGCSLVRQAHYSGSIKDAGYTTTTPTGLRGDITFGFHTTRDFKGVPTDALVPPPAPVPVPPVVPPPPIDPVHAKLQTNTLMFNAYYDLPQLHAFTPYVGAGIGMAFHDLHGITFTNGFVQRVPDKSTTNLAWSLMAGVSTDIGRGMKLDIGYRYLNMGDVAASNPAVGYQVKINDVSEHQLKLGVHAHE